MKLLSSILVAAMATAVAAAGRAQADPDGHVINTGSLIVVTTDGVAVLDGQGDLEQSRAAQKANWGPAANLPLRHSQQQIAIVRIYQELDGQPDGRRPTSKPLVDRLTGQADFGQLDQ